MTRSSKDWTRALSDMWGVAWLACAIAGALAIYAGPNYIRDKLGLKITPFNPDAATLAELRERIRARREK